ncbi:putative hydrolase [Bacillus freudenreichii]|nr:putative hydrolase [Bacillus freudenreichii]
MKMEMEQQKVVIKGDVVLKGTLTLPKTVEGLLPAIMLLPGSGNIDRNGNAVKGKFKFNIYRELAEYITTLGFATLRYDKRGVGESEGDSLRAGLWDAVSDAEAAVEWLASHPQVDPDRILVMGHSEGCIVGTALNERRPVNGLILLSGGGGGLRENLDIQRDQLNRDMRQAKGMKGFLYRSLKAPEKNEKQAKKMFNKMTSTNKDVIKVAGFVKLPAKYFREHFAYDIVGGLKKITCPVLAINGLKDFQAGPDFLKRIPEHSQGKSTCVLVENMDHGLKEQLNPISALNFKKEYLASISKPIHQELIGHLSSWLNEWKENKIKVS